MPNNYYDSVTCCQPLPEEPLKSAYQLGATYQAKKISSTGNFWWVGIHGQGGHLLTEENYHNHFVQSQASA